MKKGKGKRKICMATILLGIILCVSAVSAWLTEGGFVKTLTEQNLLEETAIAETTTEETTTEETTSVENTNTEELTTEQTAEPKDKSDWQKKIKKRYYCAKDIYGTGWKKIRGEYYYFNDEGVLQTDKMISKNKYVNEKGVLVPTSEIYSLGKESLTALEMKLQTQIAGYYGIHEIYVKNLDTNEYLAINNSEMKPASLIKLYNMATVYDQIEKNQMTKTTSVESYLHSMITESNNDSYNELLKQIGNGDVATGIRTISAFCQDTGYTDTMAGGTLRPSYFTSVWLNVSYSTPRDCGHILEDIYRGTLVSEEASEEMLSLLEQQTRKSKIPAGLPAGVKTANKTGEYGTRQHDAAIVFSDKADYIIVIMSEDDRAGISHIQSLSRTVYDYFN